MIRAIIFDVGGTLVWGNGRRFERANAWRTAMALRSRGLLTRAEAFADTLERLRHDDPKEGADFAQIGTTREHLQKVTNLFGIDADDEMLEWLEREFVATEGAQAMPIPGMPELVGCLAGHVRLGIASNTRSHLLTERILASLGIADVLDPVVTSVSAGYRKPSGRIYEAVLKRWEVDPAEVVMIGDSRRKDVRGAQDSGMRGIWLRSEALAGGADATRPESLPKGFRPDGIADDAATLLERLQELGLAI